MEPVDGPVRTCVSRREKRERDGMLRFVRAPDGHWVEDLSGRLPGRGVYVIPNAQNVRRLLKKLGETSEAESILARCEAGLTRRFLEGLGLARRTGALGRGLREVTEWLQDGRKPLLVLAEDTGPHTREKFMVLLRRHGVEDAVELLDRERLGAACGWPPTAVFGVDHPGMASRIRHDAMRWKTMNRSRAEQRQAPERDRPPGTGPEARGETAG